VILLGVCDLGASFVGGGKPRRTLDTKEYSGSNSQGYLKQQKMCTMGVGTKEVSGRLGLATAFQKPRAILTKKHGEGGRYIIWGVHKSEHHRRRETGRTTKSIRREIAPSFRPTDFLYRYSSREARKRLTKIKKRRVKRGKAAKGHKV